MSDDVRRLTTEEQRERLHLARQRGGLCAACGRVLSDGEPVYVERFVIGPSGVPGVVGVCTTARPSHVADG